MPTSPFLQGFIPPVYLTPLSPDEDGRALLARGGFAARGRRARSCERTACHPFLLQLLASRLFESRDLAATLDQLAADEMVVELLRGRLRDARGGGARAALGGGARGPAHAARSWRGARPRPRTTSTTPLYGLSMLGYLAREGEGCKLANWFFERWLRRRVATAARTP